MHGSAAVFGHSEWAKHRSSWRHAHHLKSIFTSGEVVAAIGPPVFACTLIAVFVSVFNHEVLAGHLPHWVGQLQVASLPFSLTASVLSLLIVFRTNSSYNRFDEARKVWGSNTNRTRDLARQAITWIQNPADMHKLHRLLQHIKAFPYCLKDHLLEENLLGEELLEVLDPKELNFVLHSNHRPNYVLQVISEILKQCQVSEWERLSMDENITQFHDNVGACERIFKTPIPVAYTRLTSRVLTLWHITLPFALWNSCIWLTIPATFFSAAALFYIEEVGVLIEEPFSILPLLSMSDGISSSLDGLVSDHQAALNLFCTQPYEPAVPSCEKDHVVITFEGSRSCTLDRIVRKQGIGVSAIRRGNSVS